jgi:hypothetical protein
MTRVLSVPVLVFLLLCLVFVSTGVTPLVSVGTLGLGYLLWLVRANRRDVAYTLLFLGFVLAFPLVAAITDREFVPGLATLRLGGCFALLFFLIGKRIDIGRVNLGMSVLIAMTILTVLIVCQKLLQFAGVFVSMPKGLIAQGEETLVDAARLSFLHDIGIQYYRPSLFYSEPSYFGLIVLSLFVVLISASKSSRLLSVAVLLVVASALASGSGYLVVTASVMFFLYGLTHARDGSGFGKWTMALALCVGVVGVILMFVPLDPRLSGLLRARDLSASGRLVLPIRWVNATWMDVSPFGYPVEALYPKMVSSGLMPSVVGSPFDNGVLNILMYFGVAGVAVLAALRLRVGDWFAFAYLAAALMQNGAFGNWDKAFIVGLTCVLLNSIRSAKYADSLSASPSSLWARGGPLRAGLHAPH